MDAQGGGRRARLHAVRQVGLAQQGAGHGDEREALGERRIDRRPLRDAAEEDERRGQGAQELPREGQEEGLLVGIGLEEAVPDDTEAEPDGRWQRGPELGQGRVAPEEVHGVGERAAPGELERIERAVRLEERRRSRRSRPATGRRPRRRPC